jgi:RHS repeat-associated protein
LTNDGLRSFAYDDENQLIQVWVPGQWSSVFTYDGKMRRRIRQEYTWNTNLAQWVQTNAVYYVYDGNLVIQERDVNNLPTTTYTRGKDLSGSIEAGLPRQSEATAGGIGGLLARTAQSYIDAPLAGHAFYHADANGNVTMLINSSQAVVAKYLYDAFGNVLSASGLLADANRYQFSSKEKDLNSGLVYYLYRFYDPNLQRWPNRDPMGDYSSLVYNFARKWSKRPLSVAYEAASGTTLFEFVNNNPVSEFDSVGLCPAPPCDSTAIAACLKASGVLALATANALASCDPPGPKCSVALGGLAAAALNAAQACAPCLNPPGGPLNNPGNPVVPIF